ncbi:C-terminal processing peptidase S41A [Candidatus Terasakiella magnetica]|uniref:C-terminal processing peptidase S41A n=1 Tax=Candidatus Terasakiella magnetica TaxID=1867952 RepID=A0A1C3RLA7_9PROT|nr:S41 family peptidase [Candidatus Terasakiella magnetica]SCA58003.1 C-terminal processing peptidase S41A [Candidatus Terasakiella magnetica]
MNLWSRLPSILMIVLTLAVGTVFLPSLSGCAIDDGPMGRWVSSLTGTHGLPKAAMEDLARFQTVYHEKSVEDGTRKDQFNQFVDAFKVVRRSYVTQVSDQDLITYAIEGLNDSKDKDWLNSKDDGTPEGLATPSKVVEVALDAMMAKLDPHSGYMTPAEFQELMVDTSGEFGGLGIEVQQGDGFLNVVSPIEDTPADRAGLKPGDHITHIEGVSIKEWTLTKTVRTLRGKPGSPVTVTVDREKRSPFDVTIIRDIIQVRAVKSALYDDYLHVRVVSFSERMEGDVRKAFDMARDKLGDDLKGVILDLRNNPGGLLQQSVALSDMFLDDGNVVSIRGRDEKDVRNYGAGGGDLAEGLPVVVLINGGSASASEIVSGALQDHNRAILMGRRTFGKGSVQTIMPLMREGAVRLTTALYYLPSGRTIQKVGVAPDIRLDVPEVKEDEKDKKAKEEKGAKHEFKAPREADLPNVINAKSYSNDNRHSKDGSLGNTSIKGCPEVGVKKDKELGCALEFLKAGTAKKFLAGINALEKG